ncbi:MAG: CHASE2 domain-containing protein, partial [Cyclobacteriaceae bacterium]|nr:CHASE2 domain-containing protein [Cyclobacteriaceae bacterium]
SITIVDIGYVDRTEIAKELRIVNKYKPKVIGLDFLLTADSLEKDIPLIEELAKTKNMVRAMVLHNNHPTHSTRWDSLEQFHAKFRFGKQGFSNMTITNDSIIVREMPMRQFIQENIQYAFSYQVASQFDYYKVKPKYEIGTRDFLFDESIFNYSFKLFQRKIC